MNKLLVACAALLMTACYEVDPLGPAPRMDLDSHAGTARLHGTVFDTAFDDDADLWMESWDGWMDLSATTRLDADGTYGMMYLMGDLDADEIFQPGTHEIDSLGVEVLLCGEAGGEYYDEPADDVEIEVVEDDDGLLLTRIRGELAGSKRFQEVRFVLDPDTLAPVIR